MRIRVLYFAYYKELAGTSEEEICLENDSTVGNLLEIVKRLHKPLEVEGERVIVAVNSEYAKSDARLNEGDLIALFPPVSGG